MTGAMALRNGGPHGGSVVRCAVRVLRRRSVQRLLVVGGLAVAGWLLSGGGTAFADQVRPDDGAHQLAGAPVHPAPVDDRSAKAAVSKPSAELDVLAGRARRAGSHPGRLTQAAPGPAPSHQRATPGDAHGLVPESPRGSTPKAPSRSLSESPLGVLLEAFRARALPKQSVVPELPSVPAPYEPGVPSLRPAAGAPGDTIPTAGARAAVGDKASAPAAGDQASAPAGTGEEAAGSIPSAAHAGHSADERPGDPQPASSGSSGAARTGMASETVPLGTARAVALPYGARLFARATPAPRGAVPALRTAADEPSFSPD